MSKEKEKSFKNPNLKREVRNLKSKKLLNQTQK